MAKHQLGFIPFVSKALARRRIHGVQSKLNKVKAKVCELESKVTLEKERAAALFTKGEYDRLIGALDESLDDTCECAQSAASKPSKAAVVDLEAELEKKCKEELHKQGKIKRAGGSGRVSKEDKKTIEDCMKAKGGGSLGSCRTRPRRRR